MRDCNESPRYALRGGSWNNLPEYLRSAYRNRIYADYRSRNIGFRLVYRKPPTDDQRVLRGGSWGSRPGNLRSAFRFRGSADAWFDFIGFRLIYRKSPHD